MSSSYLNRVRLLLPSAPVDDAPSDNDRRYTIYCTDLYKIPPPSSLTTLTAVKRRPVCYVELEANSGLVNAQDVIDACRSAAVGSPNPVAVVTGYTANTVDADSIARYAQHIDVVAATVAVGSPIRLAKEAGLQLSPPRRDHVVWRTLHVQVADDSRCTPAQLFAKHVCRRRVKGGSLTVSCKSADDLRAQLTRRPKLIFPAFH